jgi:hypothetical protein
MFYLFVANRTPSPPSTPTVLFTYSDDGHNGRKVRDAKTLSRHYRAAQNQKRRKNHRNKNRKRNLCARHNMFVDFTDVGWNDWIVAPPGKYIYTLNNSFGRIYILQLTERFDEL